MIGLSTLSYDPNGVVLLNARISNPYSAQRRGSVTATLDGGVSVYDTGYSEADQTLSATVRNPSRALLVQLKYLVAYYGQLLMTCDLGAFRAILETSVNDNAVTSTLTLTMRVVARVDA